MIELSWRIQKKISPEPNSGCWLWTAATDKDGYGQAYMPVGPRLQKAHRVVYEFYKGAIPEGLTLDHSCRTPGCVNPDHLEPATQKVNTLRGTSFAATNALKPICCNGHSLADAYVARRPQGDARICRQCRNAYERKHRPIYRARIRAERKGDS